MSVSKISLLFQKKTIQEVEWMDLQTFYTILFLVSKPGGRWRPILDFSRLYTFLASIENDRSVRPAVSVGGWHRLSRCLITRPDAPVSSPLLCFAFEGRFFFLSLL